MNKRFFFLLLLLLAIANVFGQTQPVISSFSPQSGVEGTSVIITGLRFSTVPANNVVFFGDVKAAVTAASATMITATVPSGASNKPISVTVNRLIATSNKPFRVTYPSDNRTFTNNSFALRSEVTASTDAYLQGSVMATGDFDGDGNVDLVSSNAYGVNALVFKNTGNAIQPFLSSPTIKMTPPVIFSDMATGDVNGDGKLDIVFVSGSSVGVYLNTSNAGSFNFASSAVFVSIGKDGGALNLVDIDGDGKLDISVSVDGGLSLIRNTSTATAMSFAAPQVTKLSIYANNNVWVQDMDGDLKPDIVYAYQKKLGILKNNSSIGTFAFGTEVTFDKSESAYFNLADVDGDDKLDVVVSEQDRVAIYKNLSTAGNFILADPQTIASAVSGKITVGDLNGDGKPDLVVSSELKKFQVFDNNSTSGTIAFVAGEICYSNSYLGRLVIADWNNDGRLDLGINHASATASILVNQLNAPAITGYQINPSTDLVSIKGKNFKEITAVKFGVSSAVNFTVVSENEITAVSPNQMQGVISVVGNKGTANFSGFSNYKAPTVTSFSPLLGGVGSTVTITGKNFSSVVGENKVYFGSVVGTVTEATSTSLTAVVPAGASYSRLTVVVNGLKTVSSQFFSVSFGDGTAVFPSVNSFAKSNTTLLTSKNAVALSVVALSDLDGDGKTDLVVGKQDYLEMYNNTGDPAAPFKSRPSYSLQLEDLDGHYLADLDGDGKLDIISRTTGNQAFKSTISFYRNISKLGALAFEKKEIIGPEFNIGLTMLSGDIDGDGREDLVAYGYSSPITIFRNIGATGEPSFRDVIHTIYPEDLNIASFDRVQLIDLDGDHKEDLVASYRSKGSTYGLMLFKNDSENGTFNLVKQYEYTNLPNFNFRIADLNNDGLPDIVLTMTASSANVKILENRSSNGTISYLAGNSYTIGSSGSLPVFGDMDGDGKVDMVMPIAGNRLALVKNNGADNGISFGNILELAVGDNIASIAMADINGDGKMDLAVVDRTQTIGQPSKTNLLLNIVRQPTLTAAEVTVTDVNNTVKLTGTNLLGATKLTVDGLQISTFSVTSDTEILAQFPARISGTVSVTTAYGTGSLYGFSSNPIPSIQSFSPMKGPIGTVVTLSGANFDAVKENNIVFFGAVRAEVLSASTTALSVKVPAGASYLPISVATGGLVAYSSSPFVVTYDNGATVFTKRNSFTPKEDIATSDGLYIDSYLNFADLDGDGKPDLLTANKLFLNTGDPKRPFTSTGYINLPFRGRVIFVDLDGDGKLDLANIEAGGVRVCRNTSTVGNFSFVTGKLFTVGQSPSDIVAADIDGDGKVDLITSNNQSNTISVLRNISFNDQLNFAPQQDYATGSAPWSLCVADFDGDGKFDIATANFVTYNISVLKNTSVKGVVSFANKQDYSTNDATTSIVAGDLDEDGKPELATTSFQYFSGARDGSIFKNQSSNGTISFSSRISYFQDSREQHLNAKLADLDGDGKADLVAVDQTSENIVIYSNKSTSTILSLSGPSAKPIIMGQIARDVVVGDWNLDGKPDLAVKSGQWLSILLNQTGLSTPEITKFSPALGGENTKVTLTGNFFENATSVSFGGIEAKSFTVLSTNTIEAVVAQNLGPVNPQEIRVTTPNGVTVIDGFTYVRKPTITSYSITGEAPNFSIVINGFDLAGATAVSFGGVAVTSFVITSSNKLTATSQVPVTGDLSVTTPGGTTIFKLADVLPTISALSTYSAATGGIVEITGTNFDNVAGVTFGGVAAQSYTRNNATKITAVVGNGASGDVVVNTSIGSAKISGFTYLPPPVITTFSPTSAATNQMVTISGNNFNAVSAVKFGNVAATSFTVVSPTTITAVVANGASGQVEVVSTGGTAKLNGFSYLPSPIVNSFSPTTAIAGQLVTITGSNFVNVTGVSFGDVAAASFKVTSATTIEAIVASGASGAVKITTSAGVATKLGFIFSTQPSISAVNELVGGSGSQIIISGTNLSAVTAVTFGGTAAASFTIESPTKIIAVVAQGASGQIMVANAKGESAFYNGFIFVPKPTITIVGTTPLINDAKAILRANTGKAFSYVWKRDGQTLNGSVGDEIEISQKGSYTVSIVNGNYTTTSEAVFVDAYFMLPVNNFKIQRFGTSCIGVNDGYFTITTVSSQRYSVAVEGNGVSRKLNFTNLLDVKQLPAGTYSACVTVEGQADFRQCFTIVIPEPEKLAVYASVTAGADKLRLQLAGATSYIIELNGNVVRTDQTEIELPLRAGANTLKVTTDQSCQGTFDKTIFYNSTVLVYPNPFRDKLSVQLPRSYTGKVIISITDTQGKIVYKDEVQTGVELIDLQLSGLNAGVYLLKVVSATSENVQKIIKQ
ncbi:FG-GAP-like repeat-containing protein [Pedobacter sp.]